MSQETVDPNLVPTGQPSQAKAAGTPNLATRGSRVAASLLDALMAMTLIVPLQIAFGVYDGFAADTAAQRRVGRPRRRRVAC